MASAAGDDDTGGGGGGGGDAVSEMDALLSWIQSVVSDDDKITRDVTTVDDLADGVILHSILASICPPYFDIGSISVDAGSNTLLRVNNIKRLLADMESFYRDSLFVEPDFSHVDPSKVAAGDTESIQQVAELVLGAGVMNDTTREQYVQHIVAMDDDVQAVLAPITQDLMQRFPSTYEFGDDDSALGSPTAAGGGGGGSTGAGGGGGSPTAVRTPSFGSLNDSTADASDLQRRLLALEIENNELKTKTGELESELVTARAAADSSTTDDTTSMELGRLQREKSRFERQVEELLQERQNLTDKLKEVKESASSKLRDLKESLREREDELDIAKSQLAEGQSVSKQLVKAKAKLKAAADVERELKELKAKNSEYLDRIMQLEEEVESADSRTTAYKQQLLELQAFKSNATRQLAERAVDLDAHKASLAESQEALDLARRQLDELRDRAPLSPQARSGGGAGGDSPAGGAGGGMMERVTPEMQERLQRLERENAKLKKAAASSAGADVLQEHLKLAQEQLMESNTELAKLKHRYSALEKSNAHSVAEVQAELESTRAELESVRAEFVRVQEEAETATARATRLAEDLQRAKALPRETGVDPALVPTLEAQITKYKASMKRSQKIILQFKTDRMKLIEYIKKREQEVGQKSQDADSLRKQVDMLNAQLKAAHKQQKNVERMLQVAERTIECQRNEAQLLSAAFYEVISQDERRKTSASAKGVTAKSSPIKSSWLERKRMESRKARQSPG